MQGKVKWFSEEKGYGFIVGADATERYFHVRDVKGASLPRNGATVSFAPLQGKKGPAATDVEILASPPSEQDDRITCRHCGKRIVPRIITSQGQLSHSVCPFCGGTIQHFNTWQWIVGVVIVAIIFFLLMR